MKKLISGIMAIAILASAVFAAQQQHLRLIRETQPLVM